MNRKSGVIFSYFLIFFQMLSSFMFTPFLINSLGQAQYGIYSLVASITSYFLLLDGGIGNAIIRYMSKFRLHDQREYQEQFLGLTLFFYSVMGIIVILIGIIVRNNLSLFLSNGLNSSELILAKNMFIITILDVAVQLATMAYSKILLAFERFSVSKTLDIIKIILRVSISVIVLKFGFGSVAITIVNLAMTILFGIITAIYVLAIIRIKPTLQNINFEFIKEIFTYSFSIFVMMAATQINLMADQVLIGILVPGAAVILGIYAAGTQINIYLQTIAGSINGVLMPGVVKLVEQGADSESLLNEMVRIGRMIFMILSIIWVVFLVNGKMFMNNWIGTENENSYYVAIIIMLPGILIHSQNIGSSILYSMNKHRTQANLKILVAALNILLTAFLIRWEPLLGAALGTAISLLVGDLVVMNVVFSKQIGISMKEYYMKLFKGILPANLVSGITGVLFSSLEFNAWSGFILNCGFMIVMYAICMWFFGMNTYEKYLIMSIFKKRKNIIKMKKRM